jgi:RimJ/RimL family protein N-acetyltransferase
MQSVFGRTRILSKLVAYELLPDAWERLRDIRLRSLRKNPEAFGATFENMSKFSEPQWRDEFSKVTHLVASTEGVDVSIMNIEILDGDFGATCWIGGCWTDPAHRGKGALRIMFDFLDQHESERGWQKQGLGVWTDNFSAITAYEKLGFVAMGEPQESTRKPGKFYQRMIRG